MAYIDSEAFKRKLIDEKKFFPCYCCKSVGRNAYRRCCGSEAWGEVKKVKTIYANALLSDEKILFWYTGQSPCWDWREFYKDFYYAGINATEYEKQHTLRIARMGFEDNTENGDCNSLIFDVLAKDFYRQFAISEDSKGEKPY